MQGQLKLKYEDMKEKKINYFSQYRLIFSDDLLKIIDGIEVVREGSGNISKTNQFNLE